ncbi:MAG: hypothetical protein WD872_07005 [Pirellulaceae bacterium]
MSIVEAPVSDMLAMVKSREIQRGMSAEARRDRTATAKHFLAAAHMELVLADDYAGAGQTENAIRSRISAASCFWRAGNSVAGRRMLGELAQEHPEAIARVQDVMDDLQRNTATGS